MLITDGYITGLRLEHGIIGNLPYHVPSRRGRIHDRTIPNEKFDWVEDHFGPLLTSKQEHHCLAECLEVVVLLAFMEKVPRLTTTREWFALRHQAGGGACHLYQFVGAKIPLTTLLYNGIRQVARDRYPGGRAGWDGLHVDANELAADGKELHIYCAEMAALGLDYSGQWLTESIYPLNATGRNLSRLSGGQLVMADFGLSKADELADTGATFLVITENSD